ncbi:WS/DGAT/MGAT family O-acyltransferase [Hellea balneolensis]|uniref:WS/DGAT/MGAT family O-acyltransferase n=1 Tax=Hellea balneolensis TaxID=287478 RepID=UPI0003FC0633|nr:wax ester/triacylglycerol synthase family O-acyltransferase [Hellea balneolensis]
MKQMQGLDTVFVSMERPIAPVHIGSVLIYDPSTANDGFVRFKDILSFIEGRLQLSDTMRQKMVKVPFGIDYPYWVQDSNFDIEYHVRHVALPKPGDWRQLCIQAARIFARPLDLSRPPWEITVVEGLDNIEGVPKGSYAMLSKVHHAAIDGVSGVDMMHALHTMTAKDETQLPPDNWRPEADPSQIGMFARGYARSLLSPIRQARAMRHTVPGMLRAAKGFVKKDFDFKALMQAPKTRFNGTVSPHRMFDARSFKLKDIKRIRALAAGSKLNDAMLSIVGGAMRKYLEHYNELPDTSVTTMAPISVRDESEKNTMGNQVAAMFVPLGSHIPLAQERMKYVTEETVKAKTFTSALGARQMAEMAKLAPAPVMNLGAMMSTRLKLADYMKPFINTVVTNVPGPPVPIYSAGAKLIGLHGMLCLVDGVKLGHVVHSYVDDVTVAFTACRSAIPDPDYYSECLQSSFEEHLEAAMVLEQQAESKAAAMSAGKTDRVKKVKAAPKARKVKMTTSKTTNPKPAKSKANGTAKNT